MLEVFPQGRGTKTAISCQSCALYREIPLTGGKKRKLCMLAGEKNPTVGMRFCQHVAGKWNDIDRILGLPSLDFSGNTGDPNTMKPGNGFSRNGEIVAKTQKIAIDDFRLNTDSHIAAKKLEGSLARPGDREAPVAHSARERA